METTASQQIKIGEQLYLDTVRLSKQQDLLQLMMDIYRPVYQHLWFDDGSGYVNSQFNQENLAAELAHPKTGFFFVVYNQEYVGILRFLMDTPTAKLSEPNTTKLHRIYLSPSVHGLGFGKVLIEWLAKFASENSQQSIWLECMDTQLAAYNFYKKMGFATFDPFILDSPKMRSEYRGMLRMKKMLR